MILAVALLSCALNAWAASEFTRPAGETRPAAVPALSPSQLPLESTRLGSEGLRVPAPEAELPGEQSQPSAAAFGVSASASAQPQAAAGSAAPLAGLDALARDAASAQRGEGQGLPAALSARYDASAPLHDDSGETPALGLSAGGPRLAPSAPRGHGDAPQPPSPKGPAGVKRYLGFLPNLLTGLNMTSGLAAMMAMMSNWTLHLGRVSLSTLSLAGGLILLANAFDAFDGRAARWLGNHDPKGIEFDSLADIVSFGAAPALLAYKAALSGFGLWALVPVALFAFGGLYRLGRFNVSAFAEASGQKAKSGFFTGLPIPGGAAVIVSFVMALPLFGAAAAPAAVGIALVTARLMASRLPYPNFKLGGSRALVAPVLVGAFIAAGLAIAGAYALIPGGIIGAYLLTGPAIAIWTGGSDVFKRELRRKAIHFCGLLYIPAFLLLGRHAPAAFGVWTALSAGFELVRLKVPAAKPFFERYLRGIFRDKEAVRPSGFFYGSLGLFLTIAAFGRHPAIVCAAIAALFFGDAVSPLLGLRFPVGLYKVRGTTRSWPGSLAGALAAFGIASLFGFTPLVALGAAAAFSVVDIFPVKPDDNFWIPLAFGAALLLLSR